MLSLRAEIAVCLFAVSLLGLITGWMLQRARAARHLGRTVAALEEEHAEAERSARRDIENLEEQLQSLGSENRKLNAENRELRAAGSRGDEDSLGETRAESIELNRRQIETQERLQRIIREREREIATLRAGLAVNEANALADTDDAADAVRTDTPDQTPAQASAQDGLDETVRIDPALLPAQLSGRAADVRAIRPVVAAGGEPAGSANASLDETLESTIDVAFLDAEEATIALDEETLSLVRGLGRGERKG